MAKVIGKSKSNLYIPYVLILKANKIYGYLSKFTKLNLFYLALKIPLVIRFEIIFNIPPTFGFRLNKKKEAKFQSIDTFSIIVILCYQAKNSSFCFEQQI